MFFRCRGDGKINQSQHGENQGLDNADDDFQKHERDGQAKGENHGHGRKQNLAGKNIAEQPERQRGHFGDLADDFNQAHESLDRIDENNGRFFPELFGNFGKSFQVDEFVKMPEQTDRENSKNVGADDGHNGQGQSGV